MRGPTARDERSHRSGAAAPPTFVEIWSFQAEPDPDAGTPGLAAEIGLRPTVDDAWFDARLALGDGTLVVVVEAGVGRLPSPGLELRCPGLWADHVVEEPLRRWSLGLEAFGLALAPEEQVGVDLGDPDLRGERVPVGWDLEWEHSRPPQWLPGGDGVHAYGGPAHVHGEVLVGADSHTLDVTGHRSHRWGPAVTSAIGSG